MIADRINPQPDAGGDYLLETEDLRVHFPTRRGLVRAVDGIDLRLRRGRTLSLVGESGSGKSVLCLAIMGLLSPRSGARVSGIVRFNGRVLDLGDVGAWKRIRGREMSMVFQEPLAALNPVMTCGRQIVESVGVGRGLRGKEARDIAAELLDTMEVPDPRGCLARYPHQLSGGLRQRAAMAMAVTGRPLLLIADEPTTALDVTVQAHVISLFHRLVSGSGMTALFVSHDLALVAGISHRVVVMYSGLVVEEAPVEDLFHDPLHPYTRGLLETADISSLEFASLPGEVPDPVDLPSGCRFAPRCPLVIEDCRQRLPDLIPFGGDRSVRCIRAGEAG